VSHVGVYKTDLRLDLRDNVNKVDLRPEEYVIREMVCLIYYVEECANEKR
jgi:hypothetical protein